MIQMHTNDIKLWRFNHAFTIVSIYLPTNRYFWSKLLFHHLLQWPWFPLFAHNCNKAHNCTCQVRHSANEQETSEQCVAYFFHHSSCSVADMPGVSISLATAAEITFTTRATPWNWPLPCTVTIRITVFPSCVKPTYVRKYLQWRSC